MTTDWASLHDRIASAIARVTASRAAAEVLAEVERTHVIIERDRWERVREWASAVYDVRITVATTEGTRLDEMRRLIAAHDALQPFDLARDAPAGEG